VVIARRPVPGREAEFEGWLRTLVAAAREAPGHIHSDIQPPTDIHPGEWVILYQFKDSESINAWLDSDVRRQLMDEGRDLTAEDVREQVLALHQQPEPVTAVASFHVKPGNEGRYGELHARLQAELSKFSGFIRSEMFEPVDGVQDQTVVVFAFDNRDHLDAWLGSDARRQLLDEIEPLLDGPRTMNIVGGFAGWFGRPGMAHVKRWKQAAMVMLGIFPITVALTAVRSWLLPDVHWIVGILFGNVFGVIALTFVVMPSLTKVFASWLSR